MPKAQQPSLPNYIDSVTRDSKFFYSNAIGLYVEVDGHRYPRDSVRELQYLVTRGPGLGKEDKPAAYYTAQLAHYGLRPRKTKEGMKKALLATLQKPPGTFFERPKRLDNVEVDLKCMWKVKNREEHLRRQQEMSKSSGSSRKRKAEAETGAGAQAKKAKVPKGEDKLSHKDVEGKFIVDAPKLVAECSGPHTRAFEVTLAHSPGNRRHLWGNFDFGVISGIIRGGMPPRDVGDTVTFLWRGREQGEDQMTYGPNNTGTLTFLGDGKIRGNMTGGFIGKVDFSCAPNPAYARRAIIWSKSVKSWKERWRGMNQRAHDAENASRWGKWQPGQDYKEKGADSDTTIAGEDEEDEDENDEEQA
ncbi:unnamed protein product [Peniophora sp. CBMAI 1063]|nr:unnamed protein product [Peniophora sp. CBMAI 1063]